MLHDGVTARKKQTLTMIIYATLWNIWLARNDKFFKIKAVSPTKRWILSSHKLLNGANTGEIIVEAGWNGDVIL